MSLGDGYGQEQKEFKGSTKDLPEGATCRGNVSAGTGCGHCSRCERQLAMIYKTDYHVVQIIDGRLKKRWGPFPSQHAAKVETRTQRLIEVSLGKVFALLSTSLEGMADD